MGNVGKNNGNPDLVCENAFIYYESQSEALLSTIKFQVI